MTRPDHSTGRLSLFSIVVPARDEEAALPRTLRDIHEAMLAEDIPHEIVVLSTTRA